MAPPLPITFGAASARGFGLFSAPAALAGDPYFEYVTMLLHGDGTNGAQNNTFLDSSTNAFTITRNGNATQGSFSPFSRADGGWSNYFDGNGDYLSVPNSTSLQLGSSDFDIECWVYLTSTAAAQRPISQADNNYEFAFYLAAGGGLTAYSFQSGGSQNFAISMGTLSTNQWYHLACTRSGSSIKAFVNGVQAGTATFAGTIDARTGGWRIGANSSGTDNINGYISNVRIVKGTAVYTAAFTPPTTPLTAITNTSLLTCQSNRFKDNSTTASAITPVGNSSVQVFNPFNPTTAYSTTTNGGSGYFDGTGDYLVGPNNNVAFQMGTGDFTSESWVYLPSSPTGDNALWGDLLWSGGYQSGWYVKINSNRTVTVRQGGTVGTWDELTSSITITVGAWAHVAIARQSGTMRLFIDGVLAASKASTWNYTNASAFNVGAANVDGIGSLLLGYIANLRIVKGTAIYTANFTPPTSPVTAVSGTSLLLNFTNGGIFDNAAMNDLETVGNAQISTAQSKFGGGSMYFDGTGDYLYEPFSTNFNLGTGSYTIEMWVRPAAVADRRGLFAVSGGSGSVPKFVVHLDSGTPTIHYNGLTGGSNINTAATSSVSANAWTHIAFCRNGSTWYWFINGTQSGTGSNSTDITFTTQPSYVGYGGEAYFAEFNGYIDDLRITKGYARYTANFTPPTAPFPDK